jgi:hypothetical protein
MELNNIILNSKGRLKNVIVLTIRFRSAALGPAALERLEAKFIQSLRYNAWCSRIFEGKFPIIFLNECKGIIIQTRKQHRRHEVTD